MNLVTGGLGDLLLVTGGMSPSIVTSPQTDQVVFDAMVALLQPLNSFTAVKHGSPDEILFPSADLCPFVGIYPKSSTESDMYDDGDYLRTTTYAIVIVVRDESPQARRSTLATLEAIVRNTLSRQPHGGFTFPAMALIGPAVWPKPRHPEQRIELTGSFTYEILTSSSHDVTDTYVY